MEEEIIITLTLDNGKELECKVISIFQAGKDDYIALLPIEDMQKEEGEVILFKYYAMGNNDEIRVENIETDEEFQNALKKFDELIEEEQ